MEQQRWEGGTVDVPVMAAQPRLPSTYEELCTQRGIARSTVQQLHDALGFSPPAASDHVRDDDLVVIELLQQLLAVGAQLPALLQETLLAVYRRHRQHRLGRPTPSATSSASSRSRAATSAWPFPPACASWT